MTHDYKRHGTSTLFAALDVKSGTVIGKCLPRHRAKEFLHFLRRIDRVVLKPRDVHLVLDNYATHKTPEVKAWLEKYPRIKLHFTPTSASWLTLVERFFAEITSKRIRRGSYTSVDDLEAATRAQIAIQTGPTNWRMSMSTLTAIPPICGPRWRAGNPRTSLPPEKSGRSGPMRWTATARPATRASCRARRRSLRTFTCGSAANGWRSCRIRMQIGQNQINTECNQKALILL
jgi:transposase